MNGYAASIIFTDVGDRAQVERLVEHALKEHEHIDILVNGAGWTVNGLFLDKPVEDWEREVAVNLWGPINCTRAVAPSMVKRGYGKIILFTDDWRLPAIGLYLSMGFEPQMSGEDMPERWDAIHRSLHARP